MKKIVLASLSAFVLFALMLSSCKQQTSNTTGWNYNDPDYGGFEYVDYYGQETGPGLVLIEGGTFSMGRVEQDVLYDWNNVPRRVTVSSFYMDETEVRNVDYREYLYWLTRVFIDYPEVEKQARPDTLVWRSKLAFNEPYVELYLRHPAYQEYPVVGVSWVQADRYCVWRTDRVNEWILIREGLLYKDPNQQGEENFSTDAYLAGQYDGAVRGPGIEDLDPSNDFRKVRMEDGVFLPRYRLPTEAEWEFAALALIGNHIDERVFHRRFFPWNGHYVRNDGRKQLGMIMANSVRGRGDFMGTAGYLNDNADVTAPVDAYWPNDYGLYCMAGNVNEWVMDVYRPLTFGDMDEFRPFRGSKYKRKVFNSDGSIADKITDPQYNLDDLMAYVTNFQKKASLNPQEEQLMTDIGDFLTRAITNRDERKLEDMQNEIRQAVELLKAAPPEAQLAPILLAEFSKVGVSMPGQLKYQEVTDEECFNRRNYNTSDNINYLDGDYESTINYDKPDRRVGHSSTSMYYQGEENADIQRGGKDMNSLINDRTRVYKGGSWRDRIYWMVPGTRRFLEETQAQADLGFRCAMTRVGSPVGF